MRSVPLNLMTLYADLLQSLEIGDTDAASIAVKTIKKKKYVYATKKDGSTRVERYLGPADDPEVKQQVDRLQHAAERVKSLRNTVTALKAARLPAPSLPLGRILEVVANAGLFERGMTLVGTAAYQTYAGALGYHLPTATLATNDVDFSVAQFVPSDNEEDFETILKRADPSFSAVWHPDDKLPKKFRASNGFVVDLLTSYGRGRKSPGEVKSLKASAIALSFQEFPAEETINTVALYGSGVLVRVPTPTRFAIHKLIVARRRAISDAGKRQKDLRQAQELIDILMEIDEPSFQDALEQARARGKSWKAAINASLKEINRDAGQGKLVIARAVRRPTHVERKRR